MTISWNIVGKHCCKIRFFYSRFNSRCSHESFLRRYPWPPYSFLLLSRIIIFSSKVATNLQGRGMQVIEYLEDYLGNICLCVTHHATPQPVCCVCLGLSVFLVFHKVLYTLLFCHRRIHLHNSVFLLPLRCRLWSAGNVRMYIPR